MKIASADKDLTSPMGVVEKNVYLRRRSLYGQEISSNVTLFDNHLLQCDSIILEIINQELLFSTFVFLCNGRNPAEMKRRVPRPWW